MKGIGSPRRISPLVAVIISVGCCCCCSGLVAASTTDDDDVVRTSHACFNSMLEISCETTAGNNALLAFDSARYGRNNSRVATHCDVPFSRNCDVDVQFLLNRACAGRQRCSIDVSVDRFTDPCGYAEFLVVVYRCVPGPEVTRSCPGSNSPVLYDHGYISSPNYPEKYFRGAHCRWTVAVRRWQTIRITLFDFELDVKRAGRCHDYLDVSSPQTTVKYFDECGATGKQIIDVQLSTADVSFVADETSSTQRGFFLYYEAVGPGCPDLPDLKHGWTVYHVDGDQLIANATCNAGFQFEDSDEVDGSFRTVTCTGYFWNGLLPKCQPAVELTPVTMITVVRQHQLQLTSSPTHVTPTMPLSTHKQISSFSSHLSLSYFGVAAGFAGVFFLLAIFLMLATYCYRRWRKRVELNRRIEMKGYKLDDEARVVVNNLQSNTVAGQLSTVVKKRDRLQLRTPLEHLNILPGNKRRSFKYNQPFNMTTTCGSSATKTRRRSPDYADSCSEDSCLAKNLLRSVTSDDDDDGAATGRLRPPTVRDLRPSGWPCSACASTMSAWKISGMLAVPTRDCPFCWASVPVVDDCENCTNLSSYRCSTPGIRITPSTESPTSSTAACVHGDHQDNVHTSVAKRRCSSLTNDVDTAAPAAACRSVPDIARNSLCGHMTATPQPASSTKDRWLSAGVASLPRPTTLPRADTLTTCLHSPSN